MAEYEIRCPQVSPGEMASADESVSVSCCMTNVSYVNAPFVALFYAIARPSPFGPVRLQSFPFCACILDVTGLRLVCTTGLCIRSKDTFCSAAHARACRLAL